MHEERNVRQNTFLYHSIVLHQDSEVAYNYLIITNEIITNVQCTQPMYIYSIRTSTDKQFLTIPYLSFPDSPLFSDCKKVET